jgi:hypothetical protein
MNSANPGQNGNASTSFMRLEDPRRTVEWERRKHTRYTTDGGVEIDPTWLLRTVVTWCEEQDIRPRRRFGGVRYDGSRYMSRNN